MEKKIKNRNRLLRKRIRALNIVLLISFIVLIFFMSMYFRQKSKVESLKVQYNEVISKQQNLEKEIINLKNDIQKATSLEFIEKRAREELKMIKQGEKIFVQDKEAEN